MKSTKAVSISFDVFAMLFEPNTIEDMIQKGVNINAYVIKQYHLKIIFPINR